MSIWCSFFKTGVNEVPIREEDGTEIGGTAHIDIATAWRGWPVVRLFILNEYEGDGTVYLKREELELLVKALQEAIKFMKENEK
jgi:hypothetical protein